MQVGAQVFEVIRYAGVAYLVLMGVSMIRDRRGDLLTGGDHGPPEPARAVVPRAASC